MGELITLSAGDDAATIDPAAGGRLRSLVAGGRERLITTPAPLAELAPVTWGSFVMTPWVGRLRDATVRWGDRRWRVPANVGRHAIHGAVFDVPWSVGRVTPEAAELSAGFDPERWPFAGRATQRISIVPGRLELEVAVDAAEAMPVAAGWHPWFRRDPGEDVAVLVDAEVVLETSDDLIPTGRLLPVGPATDLRRGPSLAGFELDNTYAGVRGATVIRWPDLEMRMGPDDGIETFVVYSPPGAVCVEPQTSWPDALRLAGEGVPGTGIAFVEAGEDFSARSTWRWGPPDR